MLRQRAWLALVCTLVVVAGTPATTAGGQGRGPDAQRHGAAAATADTSRDLSIDESRGGHTLTRHVGKTDAELADRLRRERQISAASTYPDRVTAETVVGTVLAQSQSRLRAWVARRGPRPNLVLTYNQNTGPPIGRSLRRGANVAQPCDRALVVLRWDDRRGDWYVLTSYPDTRR